MIDIEKWQKLGEFVSKNWRGTIVGILIGGGVIVSLYEKFILPSYRAQPGPSISRPGAQYETWIIRGAVDLESAKVSYTEVTTSIRPPDLQVYPDGTFIAEVLLKVKSNGQREYPRLLFSGTEDHMTSVIHISDPGSAQPPGTENYTPQHILDKQEIWLNKKVEFKLKSKDQVTPMEHAVMNEAEGG